MAEASNGPKLSALTESVGSTLFYRLLVVFVTVVAVPSGIWMGNRMVSSMDAMATAIQSINERMVRVETKIEFMQRRQP